MGMGKKQTIEWTKEEGTEEEAVSSRKHETEEETWR